MAKTTLPTNFKDDILDDSMGGSRHYRQVLNTDNTISLIDETTYTQEGSTFSAGNLNATNQAVNESVDKAVIIDDLDDVVANTSSGKVAGALAVKGLNNKLENGSKTSIKLGSSTTAAVTDRTNAELVGKAILDYIVANSSTMVGKNYTFTVYDSSGSSDDWCVSIYFSHSNGVTMGVMYQNASSSPKMYKIRRTSGGADSVIPFKSAPETTQVVTKTVTFKQNYSGTSLSETFSFSNLTQLVGVKAIATSYTKGNAYIKTIQQSISGNNVTLSVVLSADNQWVGNITVTGIGY